MFQVYVIRLLCAILDVLLFPNSQSNQEMRSKQFLYSSALAYSVKLTNEQTGEFDVENCIFRSVENDPTLREIQVCEWRKSKN